MTDTNTSYLLGERLMIIERLGKTDWQRIQVGEDGEAWQAGDLRVVYSVSEELDGNTWLHVSASRPTRLPSYSDMKRVKDLFVGPDRFAYSVWAPASEHVSIHDNCLHLWSILSGIEPLPDFTRGGRSI